ncbi:MAG: glycosyltransferase family 2 protein [Prosthecochloris sp.]|nr:glycosyltransferase family 2 protein [Prosthecochloris sp.]
MNDAEHLIAVIVVNWNNAEETLACLNSLEGAHGRGARVIVVDNGSRDGSPDRIASRCPWCELLRLDDNRGYGAACNAGARYAAGAGASFAVFLNNDTIVRDGFELELVRALGDGSETAISVPKICFAAVPDRLWYAGGIVDLEAGRVCHRGIREPDDGRYDVGGPTGYATGCCMAVRCRDFLDAGGFDENYGMYAEDVDLSLRLKGAGKQIRYVPQAKVLHRVSSSAGGELHPVKILMKHRAMIRLVRQWCGTAGVVRYLLLSPFRLVSGIVSVGSFYRRAGGGRKGVA